MNILVMPSWYPNEKDLINGSFFREQALALLKYGHRVIVLDTTFQGRNNYTGVGVLKHRHYFDDGLEVFSFQMPAVGLARTKKGGEPLYEMVAGRELERIVKSIGDIDIIHAHSFLPAGIAACRLGKKRGIPVVVTEHSSGVLLNKLGDKRREMLTETVEEASQFICVSNRLKQSVLEITGINKEIMVIPNIVNSIFMKACDRKRQDEFVFIAVGRLDAGKRFDLTIKAFKSVFQNIKSVKLWIIGSGVCSRELEALVQKLDLQDQVCLEGAMSREKLAETMQNSDAFVLPSAYETFGVVYVEALASGVPVIGSRNGGAEDIIEADNGLLIDVDDQCQLEEAMLYMYKNIDKYDRKKISQECQLKYGEEAVVKQLRKVYDSVQTRH